MPVIDAWMQHPTLRHSNHEMFDSLRRWTGRRELFEESLPVEMTVAALKAADVEIGLSAAWYGPQGALISNDEVAGFVAQSDGLLRGVAGADLAHPVRAVRELRRAVEELGFVALRIVPWLWGLPPTDRLYYPLYAACVELGVPFCTQVGHTGPLGPSETGRPIPYIDQVALDFPELTIVCGHIGYPWTTEMIAVADKHANVYIDTSAYTARRYPTDLVEYLRGRGRRRVMFGTNYPMILPSQALEHLEQLGLDEETHELFLAGNARRVFAL
ncbi:amidohydrolase family protein [Micromonospora sp. WMMA1363]|uniref:amidohydrolase family protein n=1 Tax=Micromonospora sp. WMMA1363 TaxID=3053985 RepID=UPI00259CA3E5|nr:amidohydrolase family protein [Micromonospora sp. WMMA1363]MDM4719578.1 amidohydrolase family protein [Micromonospora sp. WMMA1363]